MTITEVKKLHELAVAKDFAKYITTTDLYTVNETPDPPDAILKSTNGEYLWIEITDVFRTAEEAKEVYSSAIGRDYEHAQGLIVGPDRKITYSTVISVEKKMNKTSYQNVLEKYGKGILIIWIYDPLFSDSTLERIMEEFSAEHFSSKYFKEVYIYWPGGRGRIFTRILGQDHKDL